MTSEELFDEYYFHDCDVLNMILNDDTLNIWFILSADGNARDTEDKYWNLYVEFQFNNINNFSTTKFGYKITNKKREYLFKDCKFEEAWIDGKNSNDLNYIDLDKNGKIIMNIHSDTRPSCNVSFICNDIEVINEKLITDEELHKLYDQIENDDTPRIVLRNK
jgi:hypothetical protein